MGKLIKRIPGSCLLISNLPGSALRKLVESLEKPRMSTSILKVLPGKLDIKRHKRSILYILSNLFNPNTLLIIWRYLKVDLHDFFRILAN